MECLVSDHFVSGVEGTLGIWRVLYRSTPHLCPRSEETGNGQHACASSFWECRDEVSQDHSAANTSLPQQGRADRSHGWAGWCGAEDGGWAPCFLDMLPPGRGQELITRLICVASLETRNILGKNKTKKINTGNK